MRKSFFASALTAGLIAGTLDITAACIHAYLRNGTTPEQILRGIAGGAFGKEAAANGNMMIVWGLLFHFLIAISFTFFFFLLAKMIPSLVRYPILIAIIYGAFVWAFMRYIVLNYISTINITPIVGQEKIINTIIGAVILMVCIGLPNALLARRYLKTKK
jgi:uncharacterized membrane protein YagU involved in acid resistance